MSSCNGSPLAPTMAGVGGGGGTEARAAVPLDAPLTAPSPGPIAAPLTGTPCRSLNPSTHHMLTIEPHVFSFLLCILCRRAVFAGRRSDPGDADGNRKVARFTEIREM